MTTFRARGDAILLRKYIADTYERTEMEVPRLPVPVSEYDARRAHLQAAARRAGLDLVVSQAIYRGDAVVRRAAALQAHPLSTGPRLMLRPIPMMLARCCSARSLIACSRSWQLSSLIRNTCSMPVVARAMRE